MIQLGQPVVFAALCIAIAVPALAWALLARPEAARQRAVHNLQRDLTPSSRQETGSASSGSPLAVLARRLSPNSWLRGLDRLHARAGRPASWPMERVLVSKMVLLALGVLLAFLQGAASLQPRALVVGIIAVAFCWFLPDLLLLNRGLKRRQEVRLTLPDTMDQLSIAVEAGLGFEGALGHVARKSQGALAEELVRTLQDIRVGVPRRSAYKDLGDRVGVPDLRRFVRAIIQAEQHGISIARVLDTQAAEMRMKRRMRAEETAMKIPVKVIFPLFFCILPALIIVVMGPAVLNIVNAFAGGMFSVPSGP